VEETDSPDLPTAVRRLGVCCREADQPAGLGEDDVDTTITTATTVMASRDQVFCDLAGEAAILNLRNSVYYGLDTVGARMWTLVQEPMTVGAVRDAILQEYDVTRERCERDLLDLLQKLAREGLIVINSEAA
jgi:hypothetical protein